MTMDEVATKLPKQKNVYIYDSYNDVAVRYEDQGDKTTKAYLKVVGGKEKGVQFQAAYDYAIGGKEITKEQYDKL